MPSDAMANLLRMGHCAPAVMQTLLDRADRADDWPVRLVAGLPGGIGNTGWECGGVTAPLVMLGLRRRGERELLEDGHALCARFQACHGTLLCREIRGDRRLPTPCIGVIRRAPELFDETIARDRGDAIAADARSAFLRLQAHLAGAGFHCAHAVFAELRDLVPETEELRDATRAFVGGTLFKGMTCSAFAAGVMAVGLAMGTIERSRARVLRMIAKMVVGADAFADDVNEFNRTMNAGHAMAEWFTARFGSTQCRVLTRCDFATDEGVTRYIAGDRVARCRTIATEVAATVRGVVTRWPRRPPP